MSLVKNAEKDRFRTEAAREAAEQRLMLESPLSLQDLECFHLPFVKIVEETLATVGFDEEYELNTQRSTMLLFPAPFYKPHEATLSKYSLTDTQVRPGTKRVDSTVYGSRITICRTVDGKTGGHPLVISVYPLRSPSTFRAEVEIMINVRNIVQTIALPDLVDTRKIQTTVRNAVYDWIRETFQSDLLR